MGWVTVTQGVQPRDEVADLASPGQPGDVAEACET